MDIETTLDPNSLQIFKKKFFSARIIAGLILFSTLIYARLIHMNFSGSIGTVIELKDLAFRRTIFWGLALAAAAASFYLPKKILEIKETLTASRINAEVMTVLSKKLYQSTLISLAFAEASVLYGFILACMSKRFTDFYALALLGTALMIYHFPRYDKWKTWISANIKSA